MLLRLAILFLFLVKCVVCNQQCEVANVEMINADGSHHVFKMKQLQPCETCSSNALNAESEALQLQGNLLSVSVADATTLSMKVKFGELHQDCSAGKTDLPVGLCGGTDICMEEPEACTEAGIKKYAAIIVERGLVPIATGNSAVDKKIATGTVMLNVGFLDDAIKLFTTIIEEYPNTIAAYHGRALGYARRGIHGAGNAQAALNDYNTAIEIDENYAESYERRSEILLPLGRFAEATQDLEKALQINKSNRLYGSRGLVKFMQRNFIAAEENFRKSLDLNKMPQPNILYHLGLSLLHRGKVRNAIEVFRDVLNISPNNVDALLSISQGYREIGNLKKAKENFNKSLTLDPKNIVGWQLRANMFYATGMPRMALKDAEECLQVEPSNYVCQYMKGLSHAALGEYYPGIKTLTTVIVNGEQLPMIKATPEFIKAQYLKEYSRYLHAHLELPLEELSPDVDLDGEFRDSWAKGQPFDFTTTYKEQPGMQPSISDVSPPTFEELPTGLKSLVCKAQKLGLLSQVNLDGILANSKLNLAVGLAAIHVAQTLESYFQTPLNSKGKGSRGWKGIGWRDVFNIAIRYRRLVDPEQAIFWLDLMPKHSVSDGFKADVSFIKGQANNVKLNAYFDLVFKLLKTMLQHYSGDGIADYHGMHQEIDKATTCQDLLQIARKRKMNHQGFMVTTQVPSVQDAQKRHEGTIIMLTEPDTDQINLVITTASTRERTTGYHKELDFLFSQLHVITEDVRRTGVKYTDYEALMNMVLNIMYFFINLMPLSKGTSSVTYATIMGFFLAMGKEISGKIPHGKLLDMEALLSGAPDAFNIVTKQWMTFRKCSFQLSTLPKIQEVLPTVRSVIEILNVEDISC